MPSSIHLANALICLAQSCSSMRQLKRIHGRVIRHHLHLNTLILAKMLRFTAVSPSGDLHYARHLFHQMHQPNTFFYNTIIRGCAKSHNPCHSIPLFSCMRYNSVPPDTFTFTFLLKACSRTRTKGVYGVEIHGQVVKLGFTSHLFVQNALIHLYATNGVLVAAHRVFDETPTPDVVSWSGLVVAHVKAGKLDEARQIFERMPERDVVSWTAIISGYARVRRSKEALDLFQKMRAAGVRPDEVSMVGVISACTSLGDLEAGLSIHRYIEENGFMWMVSLCNALIDMYSKCGCVERARRVFEKMERRSLISWNSMISACAVHGQVEEAIGLFRKMEVMGVTPDGVTFLAVLSACTHMGWVNEGSELFKRMQRDYRTLVGIEHYGCMVDMLGRAGQLEEAYGLIINMPIPSNDVVWGALLGACNIHNDVGMSERVVKKLLELKPNEGGYYVLLCNIYVAAGRLEEAIEMRQFMKDKGAKKTTGCSWVGT